MNTLPNIKGVTNGCSNSLTIRNWYIDIGEDDNLCSLSHSLFLKNTSIHYSMYLENS